MTQDKQLEDAAEKYADKTYDRNSQKHYPNMREYILWRNKADNYLAGIKSELAKQYWYEQFRGEYGKYLDSIKAFDELSDEQIKDAMDKTFQLEHKQVEAGMFYNKNDMKACWNAALEFIDKVNSTCYAPNFEHFINTYPQQPTIIEAMSNPNRLSKLIKVCEDSIIKIDNNIEDMQGKIFDAKVASIILSVHARQINELAEVLKQVLLNLPQ